MRTDKQYLAAARRKLGVKMADVLAWRMADGVIVVVLVTGQKHIIPLAELEPKGMQNG